MRLHELGPPPRQPMPVQRRKLTTYVYTKPEPTTPTVRADDEVVTRGELLQLQMGLEMLFSKLNVDIDITGSHFLERVNDTRNQTQIRIGEIRDLFKKIYDKHGEAITTLTDEDQAVLTDLTTKLNIPVVVTTSRKGITLHAKTAMRKDNFKTRSKQLTVEKRVDELFDTAPVNVKWEEQSPTDCYGVFDIAGVKYFIYFRGLYGDDIKTSCSVSFGYADKRGAGKYTPRGEQGTSASTIFGVIVGLIKDFVQKEKPQVIEFSGDSDSGLGSLYKVMVKRLSGVIDQLGYTPMPSNYQFKSELFTFSRTADK